MLLGNLNVFAFVPVLPQYSIEGQCKLVLSSELIGPLVKGEMFRACLFSTSSSLVSAN